MKWFEFIQVRLYEIGFFPKNRLVGSGGALPPWVRQHHAGGGDMSAVRNRLPGASLGTGSRPSHSRERIVSSLPRESLLWLHVSPLCQILHNTTPWGKSRNWEVFPTSRECSLLLVLVSEMSPWSPRVMFRWCAYINCLCCSLINVMNILKNRTPSFHSEGLYILVRTFSKVLHYLFIEWLWLV